MAVITVRVDSEVEHALENLMREGRSRSDVVRQAILDAERAQRRAHMRAEAEALRDDPEDVAASREVAEAMAADRAW